MHKETEREAMLALAERYERWGGDDRILAAKALRAAAQSSSEVRERQRIHDLRVTLSSVVTLAESGGVNPKCLNAIAKAAKHSLQRDAAISPDTPREGKKRKCSKCSKDPTLPEPCNNVDCPYIYS